MSQTDPVFLRTWLPPAGAMFAAGYQELCGGGGCRRFADSGVQPDRPHVLSVAVKHRRLWSWQKHKYTPTDFKLDDILTGDPPINPGTHLLRDSGRMYKTEIIQMLFCLQMYQRCAVTKYRGMLLQTSALYMWEDSSRLQTFFGSLKKEEVGMDKDRCWVSVSWKRKKQTNLEPPNIQTQSAISEVYQEAFVYNVLCFDFHAILSPVSCNTSFYSSKLFISGSWIRPTVWPLRKRTSQDGHLGLWRSVLWRLSLVPS